MSRPLIFEDLISKQFNYCTHKHATTQTNHSGIALEYSSESLFLVI